MPRGKTVTLHGVVKRESPKAYLFFVEKPEDSPLSGDEFWFPKSQVSFEKDAPGDDNGTMAVPEWLVNAKVKDAGGAPPPPPPEKKKSLLEEARDAPGRPTPISLIPDEDIPF